MTEVMPGITALSQMVPLAKIDASHRLRPIKPETVEALVASIGESGLKQAISLRPGPEGKFLLVTGAHRLAAVQALGRTSIEAKVLNLSDDEAKIVEIDENLIREDLSALHFALSHQQRKAVYLRLHPETAHGKARVDKVLKAKEKGKELNTNSFQGYTIEAAKASKFSITTIGNAIRLAEGLDPEIIPWLETSPLADNAAQLNLLKENKNQQVAIIAKMRDSGIKTVGHALVALNGGRTESAPQARLLARACNLVLQLDKNHRAKLAKYMRDAALPMEGTAEVLR